MADIQESSSSDGLKRRVVDSQSTTAPTPTPENTVESQSKKLRAPTTSGGTLRILFYLAAFGFLLFVLLLAVWLYEPLKKAYRNTRTADHESEKSFQREDGFVLSTLCAFSLLPYIYISVLLSFIFKCTGLSALSLLCTTPRPWPSLWSCRLTTRRSACA